MDIDIFAEYANCTAQIKDLKDKADSLKESIILVVSKDKKEGVKAYGKFTVSNLKKWEYPESLISLEEEVKAKKAKAQSTGDATYTESPSLRFTPIKL